MLYQICRRFYNKNVGIIVTEDICIFDELDKALDFIHNEEKGDDDNNIHIDTYVVGVMLNNIYPSIQKLRKLAKKTFTTSQDFLYNIINQ